MLFYLKPMMKTYDNQSPKSLMVSPAENHHLVFFLMLLHSRIRI